MNAYDARAELDLQAKIWVRLTRDIAGGHGLQACSKTTKAGERIETTIGRITFNNVLPKDYADTLNYEIEQEGDQPSRGGRRATATSVSADVPAHAWTA